MMKLRGPIQIAAFVAALAASGMVISALFPFLYGALATHAHLPQLPEFLSFSVFFGVPGLFVAKWFGVGRIASFGTRAMVVIICDWIAYFVLFGILFYYWALTDDD